MANYRKREKVAGKYTVTQGPGGSSISSGSSTIQNGRGTRRTFVRKSNGQSYIRTTTGSGNGWYKTTQKTTSQRKPRKLKHASDKSLRAFSGEGDGTTVVVIAVIIFLMWIASHAWLVTLIKNVFLYVVCPGVLIYLAAIIAQKVKEQ